MRSLGLIAALLLLGGCNMVITDKPLFSKADADGAPGLRPGVWAGQSDASCAVDEKTQLDSWPSCAKGGVVGEDVIRTYETAGGAPAATNVDYVLAAGAPRILQLHGIELGPSSGLKLSTYFYGGLQATKTDDGGRITAYVAWLVQCGPPPPSHQTLPPGGKPALGTRDPLPGLIMDSSGQNCTTSSASALRHAAAASEKWEPSPSSSHWVRDGDR